MSDRSSASDLNRAWDRFVNARSADDAALDQDTAEVIHRLHALDAVPGANPAFKRKLRAELVHAAPVEGSIGSISSQVGTTSEPSASPARMHAGGRWGTWMEGAALGVMVLLLGALVTFAVVSRLDSDDPIVTPTAGTGLGSTGSTPNEETMGGTSTRAHLPVLEGTTHVALWQLKLAPGTAWTSPQSRPVLVEAVEGTVDLESSDGTPTNGESGGDGAIVVTNRSSNDAEVLVVLVGPAVGSLESTDGVTTHLLAGGVANGIPSGGVEIAISTVSITNSGSSVDVSGTGAAIVYVDQGSIQATVRHDSVNLRAIGLDGTVVPEEDATPLATRSDPYSVRVGDGLTLTDGGSVSLTSDQGDSSVIVVTITSVP